MAENVVTVEAAPAIQTAGEAIALNRKIKELESELETLKARLRKLGAERGCSSDTRIEVPTKLGTAQIIYAPPRWTVKDGADPFETLQHTSILYRLEEVFKRKWSLKKEVKNIVGAMSDTHQEIIMSLIDVKQVDLGIRLPK